MGGPWDDYTQGGVSVGANGLPRVVIDTGEIGKEKPADKGVVNAAMRGAAQGLSANFYDELKGIAAAGGAEDGPTFPDGTRREGIDHVIMGLAKYWFGDKDAENKYNEVVGRERALNKEAEDQHPIANTVGNIAGSMAIPLGAGMGAATLPGRMAVGAGVGAGIGALSGAGEGVGAGDRTGKAITGGALGAALGGVAPAVVEGVIQGGRVVAQPVVNAVRGAINPENEAARRVTTAIQRDMQQDPNAINRLNPTEFANSVHGGGPARIMDIGGETTRGLARSAANTSPEGRTALTQSINDAYEGQSPRIINWLNNTFHYPNAEAQQRALDQAARNVNRPAYARAYQQGSGGIWSQELEQFAQAPIVQDAIRQASLTGANDAARRGFQPVRSPFTFENGRMTLRADADGNRALPNLQFWDIVKRNLDANGSADARSFARALRDHLDDVVPSYREARAGAAHFFGAGDALEAGQNFVSSKMANGEARRALAQMNPTERQLFQDGFVSRFIQHLGEIGDRRNVLNSIAQSPAARERLSIALGPQRAAELEAQLRVEGIIDLARNAVTGNSTTARQLAELGFAGGAGSLGVHGAYNQSPGELTASAVAGALLAGRKGIDQRVARQVAEMLVSNDPRRLLQGVRLLARNGNMMESLRSVDKRIAAIGGEQVPHASIPALQAAGVGRADDQPNVPRPPGQ